MAGTALQRFGLSGWASWASQISKGLQRAQRGGRSSVRGAPVEAPPAGPALGKLIEAEIIPRLMLVARGAAAESDQAVEPAAEAVMTRPDIDAFARSVVEEDPVVVIAKVERLISGGLSSEDVLLKLLAPTARRLGEMWEEDVCDFTEVTIGLMKLHRVLRRVAADTPVAAAGGSDAPRIVLGPVEGEQHVFGLMILGELFTRSGWQVRCDPDCEAFGVEAAVADEHFDVVGLSASSDRSVKSLKSMIRRIREASLNPEIVVLVGGPAFHDDVGLAKRLGADATAIDGVRAVVTAERLVHRLDRTVEAVR